MDFILGVIILAVIWYAIKAILNNRKDNNSFNSGGYVPQPKTQGTFRNKTINTAASPNIRYCYDIVGEQSYQKNLAKIAGKKEEESKFHECHAIVSSEPFNKFDKNAVKVEINGLLVGYINRDDASKLSGKVINKTVPAVVNGGWDDGDTKGSYGVKLAINNVYDLA